MTNTINALAAAHHATLAAAEIALDRAMEAEGDASPAAVAACNEAWHAHRAARAALDAAIRAAIRAAERGDEVAYARAAGNLEAARVAYHDAADKAAIEAAYNSGLRL